MLDQQQVDHFGGKAGAGSRAGLRPENIEG
jgi:hypothetical protein